MGEHVLHVELLAIAGGLADIAHEGLLLGGGPVFVGHVFGQRCPAGEDRFTPWTGVEAGPRWRGRHGQQRRQVWGRVKTDLHLGQGWRRGRGGEGGTASSGARSERGGEILIFLEAH